MKKTEFLEICRAKIGKDLTQEETSFLETIGEGIERAMSGDAEVRKAEIERAMTEVVGKFEDGKSVADVLRGLSLKIESIEEKSKGSLTENDKYCLRKKLEEKKEEIQRAMKGDTSFSIEFHAKRAAALMTTANFMTGTGQVSENWIDDTEVAVIQYPKNFILDAISSRQVSKVPAAIVQSEQTSLEGDATVVPEGTVKPLMQYVWEKKTYTRDKYAGRIEYSEELEMDYEQLLLKVIGMFEEQVIRAWNDAILTKVINYAAPYVSTGLEGTMTKPDNFAVIGAMILHVSNADYDADIIAMNPADVWAMRLEQNANGDYKINPLAGNGFEGLQPFISTKVPVGNILIGTKRTIKEQHGAFIIRKGVYGDQLIENESTIIGEIFSIFQSPTASKLSWCYGNIATIKDALTAE